MAQRLSDDALADIAREIGFLHNDDVVRRWIRGGNVYDLEIGHVRAMASELRTARAALVEAYVVVVAVAALWHDLMDRAPEGDATPIYSHDGHDLTVGDIRRARKWLANAEKGDAT